MKKVDLESKELKTKKDESIIVKDHVKKLEDIIGNTDDNYVVLNLVGDTAKLQTSKVIVEGINRPTTTGFPKDEIPKLETPLSSYFPEAELQAMRTEAGVALCVGETKDTETIQLATEEFELVTSEEPVDVVLRKLTRELIALERQKKIVSFLEAPKIVSETGSSKGRIVEFVKVVAHDNTQSESSTVV